MMACFQGPAIGFFGEKNPQLGFNLEVSGAAGPARLVQDSRKIKMVQRQAVNCLGLK